MKKRYRVISREGDGYLVRGNIVELEELTESEEERSLFDKLADLKFIGCVDSTRLGGGDLIQIRDLATQHFKEKVMRSFDKFYSSKTSTNITELLKELQSCFEEE